MQPQQLTQSRISKNARQSLALHNQGKALVRSSIVIRISASKHGAVPIPRSRPIQCHSPFASYDDANNLRTKAREPTQKTPDTSYASGVFGSSAQTSHPTNGWGRLRRRLTARKSGLQDATRRPNRRSSAQTSPTRNQPPPSYLTRLFNRPHEEHIVRRLE